MSSRSNGAKSPKSRIEAALISRAVDLHASPLKRRIASPERVKAQSAARVSEEGEDSPDQGDEGYMWPLLGSKHSQDEISEHFWGDAVRRMHLLEQENREKTFEKAKNLFEAHARKESNHPRSQEPFLPKLKLHGLNRNKSISLESLITPRGVNVAKMQRLVSADTSFESQTSSNDFRASMSQKWTQPMKTARTFRELKEEDQEAMSTLLRSSLRNLSSVNLQLKREHIRLHSVILKSPETDCSEYFADSRSCLRDTKMLIQKLNQGLRDMLELDKEEMMYDSCYWPEVNKTVGVVSKVPSIMREKLISQAINRDASCKMSIVRRVQQEASVRESALKKLLKSEGEMSAEELIKLKKTWLTVLTSTRSIKIFSNIFRIRKAISILSLHAAMSERQDDSKIDEEYDEEHLRGVQRWLYRCILSKRWQKLRTMNMDIISAFLQVRRYLQRVRKIQRAMKEFLESTRETRRLHLHCVDLYEKNFIIRTLKSPSIQPPLTLYIDQAHELFNPGVKFEHPKSSEVKSLKIEREVKEDFIRKVTDIQQVCLTAHFRYQRLKLKRKEYILASQHYDAQVSIWKDKLMQVMLFRDAMSDWFANGEYDQQKVHQLQTGIFGPAMASKTMGLENPTRPVRPIWTGCYALSEEEACEMLRECNRTAGSTRMRRALFPEARMQFLEESA
ncbi:hypothetical protein GUITHDRAFT_104336 [Guillardia theta CCMP2712]|uniref:Uncharacterized protein n=1 Tax=Guillardia theta (strain CCMP2712) TaxID=905079 RepID=L1JNT2_GUITC|nr:hypothetical protein GUITHDRAFT_104336 [Guillardia theta CCMP2712]EKX49939.1 hypothetical protein GUITHDRAFT_104336 [Guillardia theta CCMP2712]|eukprot:XP_005836919.1 hypothetical protein GUITHDRAFT_104336 [Guillardia theta CCMP2712]